MNWTKARLFMRRWLWYTIHDAFAQTFGLLSLIGSSSGGFLLAKFGIHVANDQFTSNVVGALGGFAVGIGVYAIVAVFKTLRFMQPLAVRVADDVRSPDFTFNDQVRGYNVAAIVRNRSDVHLTDCNVHVMNAPQHDGSTGPRFVDKFDLPPKSEKTVGVAYWSSREPPYSDDNDIGLAGPAGNGLGGNPCRVPGAETNLHLRVHPYGKDNKDIHCRVWIDTAARRLRAMKLPD